MKASPLSGTQQALRIPQGSSEQALQAAEQSLLASQQAARRALEVIAAYEARHCEEPLHR